MKTPDLIEPFLAWRVWVVALGSVHTPVLRSMYFGGNWPLEHPLRATCNLGQYGESPPGYVKHDAPSARCRCGVYAVKTPDELLAYLPIFMRWTSTSAIDKVRADHMARTNKVLGRVSLWGQVLEGEKGFRATFARPIEVMVPTSFRLTDITGAGMGPGQTAEHLACSYQIPTRTIEYISASELERLHA